MAKIVMEETHSGRAQLGRFVADIEAAPHEVRLILTEGTKRIPIICTEEEINDLKSAVNRCCDHVRPAVSAVKVKRKGKAKA